MDNPIQSNPTQVKPNQPNPSQSKSPTGFEMSKASYPLYGFLIAYVNFVELLYS